jgi:hypothetical protein
MNPELLLPPVVALEPELGSSITVQALLPRPNKTIKATFSKDFIIVSSEKPAKYAYHNMNR